MVLNEMEKYSELKQEIKTTKNTEITDEEKKKINRTRANRSNEHYTKKFKGLIRTKSLKKLIGTSSLKTCIICFANIYEYEKPPTYSE